MILLSLSGFLGRFHPVVVHLPIGILLLAVLLHWLSRKPQFNNLQPAVSITLLLGALTAILSCISGWLLGVTAGANFTVGGSFVLGVAGDIAWSNVSGTDYFGPIIGDAENTINWEGSIRGVAGWDAGAFMPYLTAGLAFANASHYSDFANETADATHMGWTAGVGVAVSVAENISLDLQYRHSWYDEQEYDVGAGPFNPVFGLQTDRITAGMNFHF